MAKDTTKAAAAKKAALKGVNAKATKKMITSTSFRKPKTLRLARKPKYPRVSIPKVNSVDQYSILRFPLKTESAMKKIEDDNTLVFICDIKANKKQIKDAIKRMYQVDAEKINTLITPKGNKKAFIRLTADVDALEVASKIGFV